MMQGGDEDHERSVQEDIQEASCYEVMGADNLEGHEEDDGHEGHEGHEECKVCPP